jgi:hypothetical protein
MTLIERKHRVSRGVIGVERAGRQRLKPAAAETIANAAFATIAADTPDAYALRDRKALMLRLLRGEGDLRGRRLYRDSARADARFLVRFINQRLQFLRAESDRYVINLSCRDVTERQKAMARASLRRVYEALEEGLP